MVRDILASNPNVAPTAHVEVARGTREQAVAYLRKGRLREAMELVESESPSA
jgi:hypothetical protein